MKQVFDFREPPTDPLNAAAKMFFGLPYLFPYQRLVTATILEAAEAAGIPLKRIGEPPDPQCMIAEGYEESDYAEQDRESLARQIVVLPTGSGKSLCFQLPAVLLEGATLVIYPILSLMADQLRRLRELGFAPALIRGGQSHMERTLIFENIRSGKSRFIIANPEALLAPQTLKILKTLNIVHIVIDEAHCVSEWGETFRPAYQDLPRIIDASKAPLITAFTATASAPVLEKIEASIFGGQKVRRIIGNPDRPAIRYEALGCILRDLAVRDLIIKNQRPAIVFCSSRKGTEKLARYLRNELQDKNIRFYHAGLNKEEKNGIENWFFAHPQGVLTATCAYGMGVDKADVRTVIHRDCPPSAEAYLQESGRAGRDGAPARAILLWGPEDNRALGPSESEINRIRRSALFAYARNTQECRRTALLKLLDYRGAVEYPQSGCCDVCENQALSSLREEPRLTAFFTQNRRRYSVSAAADRLSQAGALRWSEGDAKKAILQLIDQNSLICPSKGLWKNTITVPYSFLKSAYGFIAGLKGPRKSG